LIGEPALSPHNPVNHRPKRNAAAAKKFPQWNHSAPAQLCLVRQPGLIVGGSVMQFIGRKHWAIAEGYIPAQSAFTEPALISHETACILNAGEQAAQVRLTIYFADREPVGPYRITVPARRTLHLRFNDLTDPAPVPRDTDYASVFESDVPIVVQRTRLDSRRAEVSLLSTIAYAEP